MAPRDPGTTERNEATGGDWQTSLVTAIAVLIITCPCALALAAPVAQVVASGRLFRKGVFLRSGDALERLGQVLVREFADVFGHDGIDDAVRIPLDTCGLQEALPNASYNDLFQNAFFFRGLRRYGGNSGSAQCERDSACHRVHSKRLSSQCAVLRGQSQVSAFIVQPLVEAAAV